MNVLVSAVLIPEAAAKIPDDMAHRARVRFRIVTVIAFVLVTSPSGAGDGSPQIPDVAGVWDASMSGTQQRTGFDQRDTAVLSLRQEGSRITGTLTYAGMTEAGELSGSVSDRTLRFRVELRLGPDCPARIEATATVAESYTRMSGSYSVVTCEDTVRGSIKAVKRENRSWLRNGPPRINLSGSVALRIGD